MLDTKSVTSKESSRRRKPQRKGKASAAMLIAEMPELGRMTADGVAEMTNLTPQCRTTMERCEAGA